MSDKPILTNSGVPPTPSITKQPVFKPKLNKEMTMEDLRSMQLALCEEFEKKGYVFNSVEDDNGFYNSLSLFLEETFNWPDYTGFN